MADTLFQSIDLRAIESFVATRQEEYVSLEFKTASQELSSGADKRNLAEMLSGFANSDGGVTVWGVATEKDAASGIDVASSLAPFPRAARFRARLEELSPQFVTPMVPGVIHREITYSDGSGFVVSSFPSSDIGPHMALAGHHRYFKRAGDRFYRMEHFDVSDMFGRRLRPVLMIGSVIEDGGSDNLARYIRVVIRLTNSGRAAAVAPYVYVKLLQGQTRVEQRGLSQHTRNTDGLMRTVVISQDRGTVGLFGFVGLRDLVIPPGPTLDVGIVVLSYGHNAPLSDQTVLLQVGAENAPLSETRLIVTGSEIIQLHPAWLSGAASY